MSSDDEDLQENAPHSICVYITTAFHTKYFGRLPPKSWAICIQNYPSNIHFNRWCISMVYVCIVCIALYCIVLHCIALYCIVLHCIALYCIVLHCIALYCIVLHCIALYCIVLYVLYCMCMYVCVSVSFPQTMGNFQKNVFR